MIITVKVHTSNEPGNERYYPPEVMAEALKRFMARQEPMYGELSHGRGIIRATSDIKDVSHIVRAIKQARAKLPRKQKKAYKKSGKSYMNWRRDRMVLECDIEFLNTPMGRYLKAHRKFLEVGASGHGIVNNGIVEDYTLRSVDFFPKLNFGTQFANKFTTDSINLVRSNIRRWIV